MSRRNSNFIVVILFLLIGSVGGSFIGELLGDSINLFAYSKAIGFAPFTVDFVFVQFTLGLMFVINLATILGLIIALVIYKLLR